MSRAADAFCAVAGLGYVTGVRDTLNDLVTLIVLTEYRTVRYTPDEFCYCGDRRCDRNSADVEAWTELGTLRYALKLISYGRLG